MSDFTHRDRRAHREVNRAFWAVVGLSLGLTTLAMGLPVPYVGLAAVLAMAVLGLVSVGWSERVLSSYAEDLRQARDGTGTDGFARVEAVSTVGLDRDQRSTPSPSPHVRRRPHRSRSGDASGPLDPGEERDQA